jgi:hypothetical protein
MIIIMDFHEFPTIYGVLKQNRAVEETVEKFYAGALALLGVKARQYSSHAVAVENNRMVCEWDWMWCGSPYFKVYPAMIPLLSGVGIDVPVDYLRLPFQAFAVRLPTEENPLVIDDQYHIRAILVCDGQPVDRQERRLYLWLDVGERGMGNSPVLTYCQLECVPGIQIEEAFNRLPQEPDIPGVCVPRELQARCLRVVVSICFLATGGDRLVEPDVLSKDLAAYIEAQRREDRKRVQQIVERAARRRKKGWHVGQHEQFIGHAIPSHGDGDGRSSLHFQHQRRAHFRLLPSQKVTFVRQATVRPDLPPPLLGAGYRVE